MLTANHQKLKMLYLVKIFLECTDENHPLTMPEIIDQLNSYDISADRKTLYEDIDLLRGFGLDLIAERNGRKTLYFVGSREFELPELKLLVDSVQSAKFITKKKSDELIKKLESLTSKYEAVHLQREVHIAGRVKSSNKSLYYNIDVLHDAIGTDRQISFLYYQWNVHKEMELRNDGNPYHISPWYLIWDNEYYYLVCYDSCDHLIKHFRLDKMLDIKITDDEREGKDEFKNLDIAQYSKSVFGMYGGIEECVTIRGINSMVGTLIDRFGTDLMIFPIDDDHFTAYVNVAISNQFLGWIFALGEGIQITAPESVVEHMRGEAQRLCRQYGLKQKH